MSRHLTHRDTRLGQFVIGDLEDGIAALRNALGTEDSPVRRMVLKGCIETLRGLKGEVKDELLQQSREEGETCPKE